MQLALVRTAVAALASLCSFSHVLSVFEPAFLETGKSLTKKFRIHRCTTVQQMLIHCNLKLKQK